LNWCDSRPKLLWWGGKKKDGGDKKDVARGVKDCKDAARSGGRGGKIFW